MVACQAHASLVQGAPASLTALSGVASVHLATKGMESPAKMLMSAKKSLMLAIPITESIVVKTQSRDTTVCPALHVTLALSLLEEEWNKPLLKNRFAHPVTLARTVATTAIKMQTASTWVSSPTPCSVVSVSQGMLGMAVFAERTVTWTDGPT